VTRSGLAEVRRRLAAGESSVAAEVASALDAIRASTLDAFVAVADERALREAERADSLLRALGAEAFERLPLLGATVAVKDLIQTGDLPSARGSLIPNRRPAMDAPAVARLRAAGAIVVGKTTTSEYGWSASTVSRTAPPTRNPWDPRLSSGGSSGGSAAAVAAGLCAAALGTDGSGSVRIPAAMCGVVGFKPSFGRVPYSPPCADRLAHLGPLTGCVDDAALLTEVIAGPHPGDPDSFAVPARDADAAHSSRPRPGGERPLRIAWLEFPGTDEAVRAATERAVTLLAGLGHRVERIDPPFQDPYEAMVTIIAAAEAADTRPQDEQWADPGRLAVVRHGRSLTGAAVLAAEAARLDLRIALGTVMEHYDLLAMATLPVEPFHLDAIAPPWAARPDELKWLAWSPATYPFNLSGQPALSLPVGLTANGLPAGVQLVGAFGADALVLREARRLEDAIGPLPEPRRHDAAAVRRAGGAVPASLDALDEGAVV
jgi:aspartyl-tRNA(Asn)/glutamyl-tRNA(Gln) amidotransferase subunit A